MKLIKTIDISFATCYKVISDSGKELVAFHSELFQDLKYGDWAGIGGKKSIPLTNVETWKELDECFSKCDQEAWKLVKNELVGILN